MTTINLSDLLARIGALKQKIAAEGVTLDRARELIRLEDEANPLDPFGPGFSLLDAEIAGYQAADLDEPGEAAGVTDDTDYSDCA